MNRVETIGGADSSLSVFKWLSKRVVKRVAAFREQSSYIYIYICILGLVFFIKKALFKRFQWHEYALLLRRESVYRRNVLVFEAF